MQSGGAEGDSKRVIENHDIETMRDRHVDPHARDSLRRGTHGSLAYVSDATGPRNSIPRLGPLSGSHGSQERDGWHGCPEWLANRKLIEADGIPPHDLD
jgi:hypothetical protein